MSTHALFLSVPTSNINQITGFRYWNLLLFLQDSFQDVPISHNHPSPYPFLFAIHAHLKIYRVKTPQPRQNLYNPPPKKRTWQSNQTRHITVGRIILLRAAKIRTAYINAHLEIPFLKLIWGYQQSYDGERMSSIIFSQPVNSPQNIEHLVFQSVMLLRKLHYDVWGCGGIFPYILKLDSSKEPLGWHPLSMRLYRPMAGTCVLLQRRGEPFRCADGTGHCIKWGNGSNQRRLVTNSI